MARVTATQAAQKWADRLSGASQDYINGVTNTQSDPAQAAIKQKDVAKRNFAAAIDSGLWESKLGAVTKQAWQQASIKKGAPRLADGASAAQPRMQQFFTNALPQIDSISAQVRDMPKGSIDQNIARATAMMRKMHELKGKL